MPNLHRSYTILTHDGRPASSWSKAMEFCEHVGLGLAMWNTPQSYADMKDISNSNNVETGLWTALTNTNGQDCDGANDCNGKLVN